VLAGLCCLGAAIIIGSQATVPPQFGTPATLPSASSAKYVTQTIRDLPTGTWVLADNPETDIESDFGEVVPNEWRRLLLRMTKDDGGTLDIDLLRPLWWMQEYEVIRAGNIVELDLEELGAAGPAEVQSIEPCPPIKPRLSPRHRLVTGKFIHSAANILDLYVEGLSDPIGVTPNHPFWSEDRQAFIAAAETPHRRDAAHRRWFHKPRPFNGFAKCGRAGLQPGSGWRACLLRFDERRTRPQQLFTSIRQQSHGKHTRRRNDENAGI
jgi:hypothetical protein